VVIVIHTEQRIWCHLFFAKRKNRSLPNQLVSSAFVPFGDRRNIGDMDENLALDKSKWFYHRCTYRKLLLRSESDNNHGRNNNKRDLHTLDDRNNLSYSHRIYKGRIS
jgi:hypothetical protein